MEHKNIKKGNIHIIHNLEFANITERDSYTPTTEDINKICLVLEPYGFFALRSIEPIDWRGLSSITIDLADFSVYSKDQTNELLNFKSDTYDIGATEYKCGYKRGGKEVFGIEVDCGALPNSTTKLTPIPNYNSNFNYWIDTSKSYSKDSVKHVIPLPNVAGSPYHILADILPEDKIRIITSANYTGFTTTKITLNYTKE